MPRFDAEPDFNGESAFASAPELDAEPPPPDFEIRTSSAKAKKVTFRLGR